MRLVYIANIRVPTKRAHGMQIMQMCQSFALTVEVELVVPRRLNKIKEDPFTYYNLERNFKITKLPCLDLIPLDKYLGRLAFWLQSLTFYFFLVFKVLFQKADILYTRDKFLIFASLFKKNLIYEAHGFPPKYFLYSPFLKRFKGLVVMTQKLKESFVEKGIPSDKILVAPDAVDLKTFDIKENKGACRQRFGLPQDKKIVLYTGHVYGWKGVATLFESAKSFFSAADVLFVFVGGTDKGIRHFKNEAQGLNNILIAGFRPHQEIPYWLKAADVLILPNSSQGDMSKYWTSPLKLFEYMASQRPIVASDLPSIREILNERNSVLVEPDKPQLLAEGIKLVLADANLAEAISAQAFDDVKNYTWEKRAQAVLTFLNR